MSDPLIVDHHQSGRRANHSRAARIRSARLAAFTLVEILVVLGIIILVVALGVPLFGALSGARSTESGRNIAAAALGQARTIAVNEGKYAGVMFYVDPDTDRTVLSLVVVRDPKSGLEDSDPYDKYKTFISGEEYRKPGHIANVSGNDVLQRGDRVIQLVSDMDGTFKAADYPNAVGSVSFSQYMKFYGNYRPAVRTFRARETITQPLNTGNSGIRPPRNGPFSSAAPNTDRAITSTVPVYSKSNYSGTLESTDNEFGNDRWQLDSDKSITATGEQTLLPKGVGLQIIAQAQDRPDTNATEGERYFRTGCIIFDPQGRLVLRNFSITSAETLGQNLELAVDASNIVGGLGVVLYDRETFRGNATFSDSDWLYLGNRNQNKFAVNTPLPSFNDYPSTTYAEEQAEEAWLDNNTVPLLINRFSGSMNEAN